MRSVNPATGEVIAEYDAHSDHEVQTRLQAATNAFTTWKETSFDHRATLCRRLAQLLKDDVEDLARLMTREMGKPITQAKSEVQKCAWACDYFADHAAFFLAPLPIDTDATRSRVVFEPLGPILAIMPWNFPLWQAFRFAAPNLMAGNVVLLKHASNVQGSAARMSDLFTRAGFPDGAFNHLHISSSDTEKVIRDPAIRAVALTGSTAAGRAVGKIAGEELKPSVLELGGSDPFVVLADCDLDRTVERACFARMMNNGQSCIAAKRFIVEDSIYEPFVDAFKNAIENLTVGDPLHHDTDVGPLARPDLRDELHDQVQRSINAGARCLVGGKPIDTKGFYYQPTLLADITPPMAVFCEETFGPVAALTRADSVDHAIQLANDSAFGLGASIWTTPERGEQLASRLHAGNVFVNEIVKSDPRLPFGGIKESGHGRELSQFGIREFVNIKTLYVR